jgi:hypothetical protein
MRASRFPLRLPLRYRPIGDSEWYDGTMENISRSGVLFRVDEILEPDTDVEFRFRLASPGPPNAAEISCRGRVVRTIAAARDEVNPGLAVVIEEYDFVRQPTTH